MTKPKPPKASRSQAILESAMKLLESEGAPGLSQVRVAKEAGIPQGHLTYYFPKKADLIRAVLLHFFAVVAQDILAALEKNGPVNALSILSDFVNSKNRARALLGILSVAESDPEVMQVLQERMLFMRGQVASISDPTGQDPDGSIRLAAIWGLGIQSFILDEGQEVLSGKITRLAKLLGPKG